MALAHYHRSGRPEQPDAQQQKSTQWQVFAEASEHLVNVSIPRPRTNTPYASLAFINLMERNEDRDAFFPRAHPCRFPSSGGV